MKFNSFILTLKGYVSKVLSKFLNNSKNDSQKKSNIKTFNDVFSDFNMIMDTILEETGGSFTLNNLSFSDKIYQFLVIEGRYSTKTDYRFYTDSCRGYEQGLCNEKPKLTYNDIKIYYRPSCDNYLIKITNRYNSSDIKKILSRNQLLDFILIKMEDTAEFEVI